MSEEKIMETGKELLRKQIELANLKRNKGKLAEVIKLENEIVELRRMINQELNKITKEEKPTIDIQE
jgi:hypothetical protein